MKLCQLGTVELLCLAATCPQLKFIIEIEMKDEWKRRRNLFEANIPRDKWPPANPNDMATCAAFMKAAYQRWDIEWVMRSWRENFLNGAGPLANFWKSNLKVPGSTLEPGNVELGTGAQEMYLLISDSIMSVLKKVADDDWDLEREALSEGRRKEAVPVLSSYFPWGEDNQQ